jgi:hypothetical protein
MALRPISELFKRTDAVALDETDIRHFVERYLRERLTTAALFCEGATKGRVIVRAPGALVRQEIFLLEWDLAQVLREQAQFSLRELVVTQS